MEANNNNENQSKGNAANGFDLNTLMDSPLGEIIKHLLSGGGAVAINYFFFARPMQEKIEKLEAENDNLKQNLKQLHESFNSLVDKLNEEYEERENEELQGGNTEYFEIRREDKNSYSPLRRNINTRSQKRRA
jgi:hypothetical protein